MNDDQMGTGLCSLGKLEDETRDDLAETLGPPRQDGEEGADHGRGEDDEDCADLSLISQTERTRLGMLNSWRDTVDVRRGLTRRPSRSVGLTPHAAFSVLGTVDPDPSVEDIARSICWSFDAKTKERRRRRSFRRGGEELETPGGEVSVQSVEGPLCV